MAPLTPARRLPDASTPPASTAPDALRMLAATLNSAPIGPDPAFRDALRSRLVAVATVSPLAPPVPTVAERLREWSAGWRVQRSLRTATAGLATVVAISGIGLAGSRSLPGDAFYSVKRASEDVQLALARGDVARGVRHLQFARARLQEVERLSGYHPLASATGTAADAALFDSSRASRIGATLRDMDKQTDAGARLLTTAYLVHHDAGALRTLNSFSSTQASRLQGVLSTLTAQEQPPAINSLSLVLNVQARATVLLGSTLMQPGAPGGPATSALGPIISTLPTPSAATRSHRPVKPAPSAVSTGGQRTVGNQETGGPQGGNAQPAPAPSPSSAPSSGGQTSSPSPAPSPSAHPAPSPASPSSSPSPSPTPSPTPAPIVIPVPLPVPTVCLPTPVTPTICVQQG